MGAAFRSAITAPPDKKLKSYEEAAGKNCTGTEEYLLGKAELLGSLLRNEEAKEILASIDLAKSKYPGRLLNANFNLLIDEHPNQDRGYFQSERIAREYIRRFPDDYLGYMYLGAVLGRRDEATAALALYDKAKSMVTPDQQLVFASREPLFTIVMYNEGRDADASRAVHYLIDHDPAVWQNASILLIGIFSTAKSGAPQEAKRMLTELLRVNPDAANEPLFAEPDIQKLLAQ